MSPASQAKILSVLEERQIRRVGGNININVDIRLIAATNKDLLAEINNGTFRQDLYYRLNVFHIKLPPLQERMEDIPLLADFFMQKFARRMGKVVLGFTSQVLTLFQSNDWTGNIRELANVIERAVILTEKPIIDMSCLEPDFSGGVIETESPKRSFEISMQNCRKIIVMNALKASGNNKAEAARRLGISRTYLFQMLKQFGRGET